MSVTYGALGTTGHGSSTCTPAYPSPTSGQGLFMFVSFTEATGTLPVTPTGWTLLGSSYGGGGTFNVDTGPRGSAWYKRDAAADGTEGTTTITVAASGSTTGRAISATIFSINKTLNTWQTWVNTGSYTGNTTAYSVTFTPAQQAASGDFLMWGTTWVPDSNAQSTGTVSWTGSGGTVSSRIGSANTAGHDQRHIVQTSTVTGTTSGNATYNSTAGGAVVGTTAMLHIRDTSAVALPKISTLTDSFATKDTAKWTWGTGATNVSGVARMTNVGYGFTQSIESVDRYDLTNSEISISIPAIPTRTSGSGPGLVLSLISSANQQATPENSINLQTAMSDATNDIFPVTYTNGTAAYYTITSRLLSTYRWWKIAHNGTSYVFTASTDGVTWASIASITASTLASFDPTSVRVAIRAGGTSGGSTGTWDIDYVNNPGSSTTQVIDTSPTSWAVTTRLSKTSATTWATRSQMIDTSATTWNTNVRFGTGTVSTWKTLFRVSQTRVTAWLLRPNFFTANSPINKPLLNNPTLDPNSSTIAALLEGSTTAVPGVSIVAYGTSIYYATGSTPRFTPTDASGAAGTFKVAKAGSYGQPFTGLTVPIDPSWQPAPGFTNEGYRDGAMVVVDTNGRIFSFFQFVNGTTPTCDYGGWQWYDSNTITDASGNATGAGFSRFAGVVTRDDLASGIIKHALVFPTRFTRPTDFCFPAIKTDGVYQAGGTATASNSIIEGQRIFLDPSINLDAISGITQFELMIGKALQTYGAYCMDKTSSNTGFNIICETPEPTRYIEASNYYYTISDPIYNSVGIYDEYPVMSHIPWTGNLRVVTSSNWDSGGTTRVTMSLATTWKNLGTVSKSLATTWPVRTSVSKNSTTSWAVTAQTIKTSSGTWAVRASALKTSATTWATALRVQATSTTTWPITFRFAKTVLTQWPVYLRTSSTSDNTWTVLVRTQMALGNTWNIGSRLVSELSSIWFVNQRFNKTSLTAWGVQLPVLTTSANTWAVRKQATKTSSNTWAVRAQIFKSTSTQWATSQRVVATASSTWALSQRVSAVTNTSWSARLYVLSAQTTVWWSDYFRISTTSQTSWPIYTSVETSFSDSWKIEESGIKKHVVSEWSVLTRFVATRSTAWNLDARTSGFVTFTEWNVNSRTTSVFPTTWGQSRRFVGTYSTTWNQSQVVTGTSPTVWKVAERAAWTFSTTWPIRTTLVSTQATSWAVTARLVGSRSASWSIYTSVLDFASINWRTYTRLARELVSTWVVAKRVVDTESTTWATIGRVYLTSATSWNSLSFVSNTRSVIWNVRQRVENSQSDAWIVKIRDAITFNFRWNVYRPVQVTSATSWASSNRLTATDSITWDVERRFIQVGFVQWDIYNQAVETFEVAWSIIEISETRYVRVSMQEFQQTVQATRNGPTMRLHPQAREWYDVRITSDPDVDEDWEASFDGGLTWNQPRAERDYHFRWFVAGPQYTTVPGDEQVYVQLSRSCTPLIRSMSNGALVVRDAPTILITVN